MFLRVELEFSAPSCDVLRRPSPTQRFEFDFNYFFFRKYLKRCLPLFVKLTSKDQMDFIETKVPQRLTKLKSSFQDKKK